MSETATTPALWLWDLYFALITAAVAAVVAVDDGSSLRERTVALGALAAMTVLHLAAGRPLALRETADTKALLVLLVQLALFATAILFVPVSTWLMFGVIPLIFQLATIRRAVALIIAINVVPVLAELRTDPGGIAVDVVIAVISSVAGICMGLWIQRALEQSQERAVLIAQLEASRAELARVSHEAGVAQERNRLAGEIHYTLAQGFTSIITLIQVADPALADERLALAVRTARENLAESRALVAALSPSALASASLPEAVRRQAARFSEEAGVAASFRTIGDLRELSTPVEVVLLRATQEALTNVRRHAAATEAAVTLAYTPESVRLVVRDDGCGFPAAAGDGFGLSGMRSRAAQVGGTLTVHSTADTGTTLELEVPLPAAGEGSPR